MKQYLRPEVQAFALAVEEQLRANDHKGGWKNCSPGWLLERLYQEADELAGALVRCKSQPEKIAKEAADVANFAMMIVDVLGGLQILADLEDGDPA